MSSLGTEMERSFPPSTSTQQLLDYVLRNADAHSLDTRGDYPESAVSKIRPIQTQVYSLVSECARNRSENPEILVAVLRFVGEFGGAQDLPVLQFVTASEDRPEVWFAVIDAIRSIGGIAARDALGMIRNTEPTLPDAVRIAAREAQSEVECNGEYDLFHGAAVCTFSQQKLSIRSAADQSFSDYETLKEQLLHGESESSRELISIFNELDWA